MEVSATPSSTATSKVPKQTLERAVTALLKWKSTKNETQKPQLLSSDEFIYLVITLNKIPQKGRTNAYKIPVPNPLFTSQDNPEFCLFIDDRNLSSKAAKQKVLEEQIGISKVIKLSKLKSDYKAFESKRKLCDSYDMFFADKRIVPLLSKAIGRHFYKKKKIPVPIELGHKNWKEQIERVCGSALLFVNTGTCCVVKVAKSSMSKEEIVENLVAVVDGFAEFVPKKWGNVRSLHLKFSDSVALPVYQAVPEMKMKIGGMVVRKDDNVGSDNKIEESEKIEKNEKKGKKKKGGKINVRYMDSVVGVGEMVGEDESGSDGEGEIEGNEDGELGSAEIVGKKRKSEDLEKKVKKSSAAKVKKGESGSKLKKAKKVVGKSVIEKKSKRNKVAV